MRFSIVTSFFILFIFSGCTNGPLEFNAKNSGRQIASDKINEEVLSELKIEAQEKSQTLEFPSGVNKTEQEKMWHLTEGSDIYPTLWLINLKSLLSNQKNSFFFDDLDKKFGLIKNPYQKDSMSPYAWVGLTAVWDGEAQREQDLILENVYDVRSLPKVKKLKNGKPSIVMTGANCAFCHTGSINGEAGKNPLIIDGAPAMIDMKGFFYDIIGSTYQMMFDEKMLVTFYERLGVTQAEEKAYHFVSDLKKELKVEDTLLSEAIKLLIKAPIIGKKINASVATKAGILLYEKKVVLKKYLIRMLKETYDLKEVTPIMDKRMEYLTWFGAPNPDVVTTTEGYGRTDAFGRISNATIRKLSYTHLTAPVSLPPMYGMKYKAFYHYNANTNSLVARNIGQSFGLGAVVVSELPGSVKKFESTTNIPNLIELEKLIHKVPIPQYTKFFPDKKIDKNLIVQGCDVYINKCVKCHEANTERVGPAKVLIDHKLIKMDEIDTDRQYVKNISKEALGVSFKKAIFDFTDQVKDGYYTQFEIPVREQKLNAQEELRGKEIFRDTFLGESRFSAESELAYTNIKPGYAYVARHLAGIWSTAPYLHNGSVANISDLLLPESKRSKKLVVGYLNYDHNKLGFESHEDLHECQDALDPYCLDTSIIGNSNRGHSPSMYGGELKNADKKALIEFLKVLTPELEYSWKTPSLYKIENNKCILR